MNSTLFQRHSLLFDATTAGLVIVGLIRLRQIQGPQGVRLTKIHRTIILLTLFVILSGLWAPDMNQFLHRWKSGAPLAIVGCVAPLLVTNCYDLRKVLVWTLSIGTCLTLLFLFLAEWGGRGLVFRTDSGNALDSAGAVLDVAGLAASTAIIAALMKNVKFPLWDLVRWIIVLLGIALCFKTQSRGPTVSAILIVGLLSPYVERSSNSGKRLAIFVGVAVLLAIGFFLIVPLVQQGQGRWSSQHMEKAYGGRLQMWWGLIAAWLDSGPFTWVFGLGATASFSAVGFYPHNVPVEILCEAGVIGALLFLSIFLESGKLFRGALRVKSARFDRRTVVVISALLFHEFLMSLKAGSMSTGITIFVYAAILERGVFLPLERKKKLRTRRDLPMPGVPSPRFPT